MHVPPHRHIRETGILRYIGSAQQSSNFQGFLGWP